MNYKGIKDRIHVCGHCGTEFKQGYHRRKPPKYCSPECSREHRSAMKMAASDAKFDQGGVVYHTTQRRILSERFGYKCIDCGISEWNGKEIVLQVDHIDGDPANNRGSNLRLLCPNCHSQTETYKGGNKNNPKTDSRSRLHREIYKRAKKIADGSPGGNRTHIVP